RVLEPLPPRQLARRHNERGREVDILAIIKDAAGITPLSSFSFELLSGYPRTRLRARMKTALLASLFCVSAISIFADEGMWLFNQPPRQLLRDRHKFDVTDAWLEHLQKSSVRFNSGGSGSFVSEDGLLISNHHVGADALQKVSTKEKNYLRDGFHARTLAEE